MIFLKEKGEFIFPITDGRIKTLGGDQDLRTSTLVRHRPIQGENHIDFLGESEGSLPQPHDSIPDAGEAVHDFGPCQETSYTAITLNHESNFTRREKNHSLFHWNTLTFPELLIRIWMSSKRNASIFVGISMGLEKCQILGQVSHNLLYSKKNLLTDMCGPGGRLTRKQLTSKPDHLWPELWKSMGKHAKLKKKQKWSEEKIHLENAQKLRRIYFIDPEDTEFTETIKNARKKLKTVAPSMPCKKWIHKNAYGKFDTASSWRPYCKKRRQFITAHYYLVHTFLPKPQFMKIPAPKAAVDKEWEKLEKF